MKSIEADSESLNLCLFGGAQDALYNYIPFKHLEKHQQQVFLDSLPETSGVEVKMKQRSLHSQHFRKLLESVPETLQEAVSYYTRDEMTVDFKDEFQENVTVDIPQSHYTIPADPNTVIEGIDKEETQTVTESQFTSRQYLTKPQKPSLSGRQLAALMHPATRIEHQQDSITGMNASSLQSILGNELLLELNELQFEGVMVDDLEPCFVTFALYSLDRERKLCEDVELDLNSDTLISMIGIQTDNVDQVTTFRRALFNIDPLEEKDVVVGFRIYKTLIDDEFDKEYLHNINDAKQSKQSTEEDKEKQKLRKRYINNCADLGEFRQPLGFGFFKVIENSQWNQKLFQQDPKEKSIQSQSIILDRDWSENKSLGLEIKKIYRWDDIQGNGKSNLEIAVQIQQQEKEILQNIMNEQNQTTEQLQMINIGLEKGSDQARFVHMLQELNRDPDNFKLIPIKMVVDIMHINQAVVPHIVTPFLESIRVKGVVEKEKQIEKIRKQKYEQQEAEFQVIRKMREVEYQEKDKQREDEKQKQNILKTETKKQKEERELKEKSDKLKYEQDKQLDESLQREREQQNNNLDIKMKKLINYEKQEVEINIENKFDQQEENDEIIILEQLLNGDPVRQVQSFNAPPLPMPQNSFTHFLYIYPEMIDFTIKVNGQRVRNISVKICVRDTDTQPKYLPSLSEVMNFNAKEGLYNAWNCDGTLPLICGGSHSKRRIGTYTTAVMYHVNQPRLYDEVKIALPFSLNPKLHVLFTFYHVSCQAAKDQEVKKANDRKLRNIVGYAILPIGSEEWIRNDRRNALPIAATLETGYMTTILRQEREKKEALLSPAERAKLLNSTGFGPKTQKSISDNNNSSTGQQEEKGCDISYLNSGKPMFVVKSMLLSTVVPRDPLVRKILSEKNYYDFEQENQIFVDKSHQFTNIQNATDILNQKQSLITQTRSKFDKEQTSEALQTKQKLLSDEGAVELNHLQGVGSLFQYTDSSIFPEEIKKRGMKLERKDFARYFSSIMNILLRKLIRIAVNYKNRYTTSVIDVLPPSERKEGNCEDLLNMETDFISITSNQSLLRKVDRVCFEQGYGSKVVHKSDIEKKISETDSNTSNSNNNSSIKGKKSHAPASLQQKKVSPKPSVEAKDQIKQTYSQPSNTNESKKNDFSFDIPDSPTTHDASQPLLFPIMKERHPRSLLSIIKKDQDNDNDDIQSSTRHSSTLKKTNNWIRTDIHTVILRVWLQQMMICAWKLMAERVEFEIRYLANRPQKMQYPSQNSPRIHPNQSLTNSSSKGNLSQTLPLGQTQDTLLKQMGQQYLQSSVSSTGRAAAQNRKTTAADGNIDILSLTLNLNPEKNITNPQSPKFSPKISPKISTFPSIQTNTLKMTDINFSQENRSLKDVATDGTIIGENMDQSTRKLAEIAKKLSQVVDPILPINVFTLFKPLQVSKEVFSYDDSNETKNKRPVPKQIDKKITKDQSADDALSFGSAVSPEFDDQNQVQSEENVIQEAQETDQSLIPILPSLLTFLRMGKMMALLPRTIGLRPQKLKGQKKKINDKGSKIDKKKKDVSNQIISLDTPRSRQSTGTNKISNSKLLFHDNDDEDDDDEQNEDKLKIDPVEIVPIDEQWGDCVWQWIIIGSMKEHPLIIDCIDQMDLSQNSWFFFSAIIKSMYVSTYYRLEQAESKNKKNIKKKKKTKNNWESEPNIINVNGKGEFSEDFYTLLQAFVVYAAIVASFSQPLQQKALVSELATFITHLWFICSNVSRINQIVLLFLKTFASPDRLHDHRSNKEVIETLLEFWQILTSSEHWIRVSLQSGVIQDTKLMLQTEPDPQQKMAEEKLAAQQLAKINTEQLKQKEQNDGLVKSDKKILTGNKNEQKDTGKTTTGGQTSDQQSAGSKIVQQPLQISDDNSQTQRQTYSLYNIHNNLGLQTAPIRIGQQLKLYNNRQLLSGFEAQNLNEKIKFNKDAHYLFFLPTIFVDSIFQCEFAVMALNNKIKAEIPAGRDFSSLQQPIGGKDDYKTVQSSQRLKTLTQQDFDEMQQQTLKTQSGLGQTSSQILQTLQVQQSLQQAGSIKIKRSNTDDVMVSLRPFSMFREMLVRFDVDVKTSTELAKMCCSRTHFAFLQMAVDNWSTLIKADNMELAQLIQLGHDPDTDSTKIKTTKDLGALASLASQGGAVGLMMNEVQQPTIGQLQQQQQDKQSTANNQLITEIELYDVHLICAWIFLNSDVNVLRRYFLSIIEPPPLITSTLFTDHKTKKHKHSNTIKLLNQEQSQVSNIQRKSDGGQSVQQLPSQGQTKPTNEYIQKQQVKKERQFRMLLLLNSMIELFHPMHLKTFLVETVLQNEKSERTNTNKRQIEADKKQSVRYQTKSQLVAISNPIIQGASSVSSTSANFLIEQNSNSITGTVSTPKALVSEVQQMPMTQTALGLKEDGQLVVHANQTVKLAGGTCMVQFQMFLNYRLTQKQKTEANQISITQAQQVNSQKLLPVVVQKTPLAMTSSKTSDKSLQIPGSDTARSTTPNPKSSSIQSPSLTAADSVDGKNKSHPSIQNIFSATGSQQESKTAEDTLHMQKQGSTNVAQQQKKDQVYYTQMLKFFNVKCGEPFAKSNANNQLWPLGFIAKDIFTIVLKTVTEILSEFLAITVHHKYANEGKLWTSKPALLFQDTGFNAVIDVYQKCIDEVAQMGVLNKKSKLQTVIQLQLYRYEPWIFGASSAVILHDQMCKQTCERGLGYIHVKFIWQLAIQLMRLEQSLESILQILGFVYMLIKMTPYYVLVEDKKLCKKLISSLVANGKSEFAAVRFCTASILYLLAKLNKLIQGNILRIQSLFTICISKGSKLKKLTKQQRQEYKKQQSIQQQQELNKQIQKAAEREKEAKQKQGQKGEKEKTAPTADEQAEKDKEQAKREVDQLKQNKQIMSELDDTITEQEEIAMKDTLDKFISFAEKDPDTSPKLKEEAVSMGKLLNNVFLEACAVAKLKNVDDELTADNAYKLCMNYARFPELRLTKFDTLCAVQETSQNYDEAAHTQLAKCAVILDIVSAMLRVNEKVRRWKEQQESKKKLFQNQNVQNESQSFLKTALNTGLGAQTQLGSQQAQQQQQKNATILQEQQDENQKPGNSEDKLDPDSIDQLMKIQGLFYRDIMIDITFPNLLPIRSDMLIQDQFGLLRLDTRSEDEKISANKKKKVSSKKVSKDKQDQLAILPLQKQQQQQELDEMATLRQITQGYGSASCCWDHIFFSILPSFKLYTLKELETFLNDKDMAETIYQSSFFDIPICVKELWHAILLFQKAELYEYAVSVSRILESFLIAADDIKSLNHLYVQMMGDSTRKIADLGVKIRIRTCFYRVGMYGIPFEEENGKQFIMKEYNYLNVGAMKFKLLDKYKARFNGELKSDSDIVVVNPSETIRTTTKQTIEPVVISSTNVEDVEKKGGEKSEIPLIHLMSVKPYFQDEVGADEDDEDEENDDIDGFVRKNEFYRHVRLRRFYFDEQFTKQEEEIKKGIFQPNTPAPQAPVLHPPGWMPKKKNPPGMDETWLKRTIYTTTDPLPFLTKRVKIIKDKTLEIEFTPAQTAMMDVRKRTTEIKRMMKAAFDERQLTHILQGAVAPSVNAGVISIYRCFLGQENQKLRIERKQKEAEEKKKRKSQFTAEKNAIENKWAIELELLKSDKDAYQKKEKSFQEAKDANLKQFKETEKLYQNEIDELDSEDKKKDEIFRRYISL
ncbi:MAG: hypothetical protein EZS28_006889, partial [Streblomastix strix]